MSTMTITISKKELEAMLQPMVAEIIGPTLLKETTDTTSLKDTLDRIDARLEIMEALEHNKNKRYQ